MWDFCAPLWCPYSAHFWKNILITNSNEIQAKYWYTINKDTNTRNRDSLWCYLGVQWKENGGLAWYGLMANISWYKYKYNIRQILIDNGFKYKYDERILTMLPLGRMMRGKTSRVHTTSRPLPSSNLPLPQLRKGIGRKPFSRLCLALSLYV